MRKIILALVLSLAACSYFDTEVARLTNPQNSSEYIALYSDKGDCPKKTGYEEARKVKLLLKGKSYMGCYAESNGLVLIRFDDGDTVILPREAFK